MTYAYGAMTKRIALCGTRYYELANGAMRAVVPGARRLSPRRSSTRMLSCRCSPRQRSSGDVAAINRSITAANGILAAVKGSIAAINKVIAAGNEGVVAKKEGV
eukprot:3670146-Rhodomonas_salina.1